ncbi:MAG: hypothetical protein HY329_06305 [Chloroflexi bacterium]|nr:hypothetical protein [Chloroflexota bacterium]
MLHVKKLALGAVAAVLLTAVALGASAYAQTPPPTSPGPAGGPGAYAQVFQQKLAALLGISPQTLQGHVKQAQLQTVDQMVADGRLTAEQATQARQRIESRGGQLPFFAGRGGPGGPGGRGGHHGPGQHGPRGGAGVMLPAIAQRLGVTEQELKTQLRSGTKLSDLAAQKNVSKDDLKAAVVNAAKARLDAEVAAGRLTQQQADAMLQRVQAEFDRLWDGTAGPQGGRGGPRGGRPGPQGAPGPQGTPGR